MTLRVGLALVAFMVLSGCGVGMHERKWFMSVETPGATEAIIIVFRHSAEVPDQQNPFADPPSLSINGRPLGKLEQSNYRTVKVTPGTARIELAGASYRIAGSFRAQAGRKLYVRLHSEEYAPSTGAIVPIPGFGLVGGGKRYLRYSLQAVDEQKALPEAAETYLRPGQESPVQL